MKVFVVCEAVGAWMYLFLCFYSFLFLTIECGSAGAQMYLFSLHSPIAFPTSLVLESGSLGSHSG